MFPSHSSAPPPEPPFGVSAVRTPEWYRLDAGEVVRHLASSEQSGLDKVEARRRLGKYGPNELVRRGGMSPWRVLLDQFRSVLILILLAAIGISILLGDTVEAVAIAVIVVFAALLGFVQEYRAEHALEALGRLAAPTATAIRAGDVVDIPARELVPGDVVSLRAGDRVPADARLLETTNLKLDEAPLTGESQPVEKDPSPISADAAIADRHNMVYAGTIATYGRGRAIVVATGMDTEFGRIAGFLQTVEKAKSPLQQSLDRVASLLARTALVIIAVIVGVGVFRGSPPLETLIFGLALAVAVVPEALPAVVTISLAIGVQRMAKRNSLVRRLPAVETLGSVSVICSDKTGTLTCDEMTVRRVCVAGRVLDVSGSGYEPEGDFTFNGAPVEVDSALISLLEAAVLSSDARLVKRDAEGDGSGPSGRRGATQGDPTEVALVVAAAKAGLDGNELDARCPRIDEIPFTSESKRMTTLHQRAGESVAYAKGAPEIVFGSSTRVLRGDGIFPIEEIDRKSILDEAERMAGEALRVLGVASKAGATREDAERGMVFLGLVGMLDPPRPQARAAIRTCLDAGIVPIMITGDHPATAAAVARELDFPLGPAVVTGENLDSMDDAEFIRRLPELSVFARVSPAHKLRIVTALQDQGKLVAMTGDGINDAPALKKADIGIAMGISGTDVTREAADMTLTDDNFASIVAAVEEGRGVYENIKKYLVFLLSSNLGEMLLLATSALAGWPLPLSAVMILYVNLATDGLPALALAVDPHDTNVMRSRPRDPRQGIFTTPVTTLLLVGGLWSAAVHLVFFNGLLAAGWEMGRAMTMVLCSLVLVEFFKAYCFRSPSRPVLVRPFANRWLNMAIVWELALLLAVIYVPFLRNAMGTFPLRPGDWLRITSVAVTILPVIEITKWVLARKAERGRRRGSA